MLLRVLLLSVLISLAPGRRSIWSDGINGNRPTGGRHLLDGGKLALKTRYAGQLPID
jgi:hypothetical protein